MMNARPRVEKKCKVFNLPPGFLLQIKIRNVYTQNFDNTNKNTKLLLTKYRLIINTTLRDSLLTFILLVISKCVQLGPQSGLVATYAKFMQ